MKVFTYQEDIYGIEGACVALGNFDGIHIGHQALIKECVRIAKEKGLSAVVFTFMDHPMNVIAGKTVVKSIQTFEEKAQVAEKLGADYLVALRFTPEIMNMSPDSFVREFLVGSLKCREAVCGFNYSYGYKAQGNPESLRLAGEEYGFGVNVIDAVTVNGETVSSTKIRGFLAEGRIEDYKAFTGREYTITGNVVKGLHNGTRMGFPTVNLNLSEEMALPANGVYFTETEIAGRVYDSITNVGNKPTVGEFSKNAETYIFGYDADAYGKRLKIRFLKMHRPEYKFKDMDELSAQIAKDCAAAGDYFGGLK